MTSDWSPGDDFPAVADAVTTVTLTSAGATSTVTGALPRRVTVREARASGGHYTREDVKWNLPQSQAPAPPEVGALLLDDQQRAWRVLRVDHDTLASRWRCWCRRLLLAEGLTQRVHIRRAAWSRDAHGAAVATWSVWKSNLAAHIQPMAGALQVEHERLGLRAMRRVFLAAALEAISDLRVAQPATGAEYAVVGFRWPERLDELFALDVTEISSP